MYKKMTLVFICFLCFITQSLSVQAITNHSIDISVNLLDNGDAEIVEVWDMSIDEGTEVYKFESQLGNSEIKNLVVQDQTGTVYETLSSWDTKKNKEQKAYKAGLNKTSSGYEICWGVSQYGKNTYRVSYTLTNFIQSYDDYDGFNQRLVNDELNDPPKKVSITIYSNGVEFTKENTQYWGFGFGGEDNLLLFPDKFTATPNHSFSSNNHATIMMQFEKGMFHPQKSVNGSIEELKNTAFEGSSYNDDGFPVSLIVLIVGIGVIVFAFAIVIYYHSKSRTVRHLSLSKAEIPFFRDIPFKDDLIMSYYGLKITDQLKKETDIIGAYLLKWVLDRKIIIEEYMHDGFFRDSKKVRITFNSDGIELKGHEEALFNYLKMAAGRDGILEEKEFEKWATTHYEKIKTLLTEIEVDGQNMFERDRLFNNVKETACFGLLSRMRYVVNEQGIRRIKELLGFKEYLKEFTIIDERDIQEVHIWKNYLVYASLFGIASQVSERFEKVYPKYLKEILPPNYDTYRTIMYIHHMNYVFGRGYQSGIDASAMSSGSSSFGGGGGFSGGGSGGGVR